MQDKVFYAICLGFICGVLLRSFVFINIFTIIFVSIIGLALILFFTLISKNRWGIIFSIFALMFAFGILRFHLADKPAPYVLKSQTDQKISLIGNIVDEPNIGENSQRLTVEIEVEKSKVKILLTVKNQGEDFKYGDRVDFSGKLDKIENFITDQGKEFNYVNYLRKDGILYSMYYPKIEIISRDGGNFIKRGLFSIKEKFLEKINLVIPNPESLLMGGLILGERSSFTRDLRQSFVDTGTIHIVALSGYNVTIVAEWIMKVFSFLPYSWGFGIGIFGIFLFIIMSGGSSTAIRAGVMASLALIARATGRNYDVARALILAGVAMILLNPLILVYDVSFQLSFIATVAVIFIAPRIERHFSWVTERFQLRDIITVTCAVYVFVLPFILYKMGNLSLVALPANILILPFIPFTMFLGFMTGFLGSVFYILAIPFGYLSYFILHYELGVVNFFAHVPFASFTIPNFPFLITLLIYAYFIYRLFGRNIKSFFSTNKI